jgi:hypothetical protein
MNKNQELIESCRETLEGEQEPHLMEWIDMVESLCNALEKADQNITQLTRAKTDHVVWDDQPRQAGIQ